VLFWRATFVHPVGTLKYCIFGHPRLLRRGLSSAPTEIGTGVNIRCADRVQRGFSEQAPQLAAEA
jgi:hypothetical protein